MNSKYFIMTTEQKEFIEEVFKCLDIDFEDVLEIANLREHSKKIGLLETQNNKITEALVQLNNRLARIEREFMQLSIDEEQEVLAQNE